MTRPVSRRDELLEKFMADELTPHEETELHWLLRKLVADEAEPLNERLLASLVSRLMDGKRL